MTQCDKAHAMWILSNGTVANFIMHGSKSVWKFALQQTAGTMYVQMFIRACVSRALTGERGGKCGWVDVEREHRWACLFWCAAFRLLSTLQVLRGTKRGHMAGPCKAKQKASFLHSVCLLLYLYFYCRSTVHAQPQTYWAFLFSALRNGFRLVPVHVFVDKQVHMLLPQGQSGHLCTPLSAKLHADKTIYHPPAGTMYGSLFNIYMTMLWFIGALIILCSRMWLKL